MTSEAPYRWTCITENADFAPRDGAGALVLDDRMWLLGGWNPDDPAHFPKICNSEIWSSTDGLTWSLDVPEAPWEPRHCAGYVLHQDCMWIVGGDTNQYHYQYDAWKSDDGLHWRQVTDRLPWGKRALHYTVAFDGAIWVMGGQLMPKHVPGEEAFYHDVWRSEDGIRWERILEHAPWAERGQIGGCAVHQGRIWLLGGGTFETPNRPDRVFYHDVWSTADGIHWELATEHAPWHPREYHEVAVFDNRLWVLEGWNQENRNDVWYSEDGVTWHELPDTPWAPRHAASVFVYRDALWVVAGNNMTPDVWKLTRV